MNQIEAKWLLLREMVGWRRRGYANLRDRIGDIHVDGVTGMSGVEYQIEIQVVWDDKPTGAIRVIGSIDDGRWRAYCPPGYSIIASKPRESA